MRARAAKYLALASLLAMAWSVTSHAAGRTYTLDADFDEGVLAGPNHDAPNSNQLQISPDVHTSLGPHLWVANYAKDVVTKVDTNTGRQIGMYDSVLAQNWDGTTVPVPAPRSSCNSPSRTTVDADGNAFVANRGYCNYNSSISTIASLTKIAGTLGHCVDRNGNGRIDTSRDANGDGLININDPAEFFGQADECLLWTRTYAAPGDWGRSVAVDADQNLWLAGYHTARMYKLDGRTGALLQTIDPNAETGVAANVYGLAVDLRGFIYTSDPGQLRLRRIDPSAPPGQRVVSINSPVPTYGLAVNTEGIVWLGNWSPQGGGGVVRVDFNARTARIMAVPSGSDCTGYSRGVAVDDDEEVWVACWQNSRLLRYNSAGTFLGSYQTCTGTLGVAIDSQGRIWSSNQTSNSLNRLDKYTGSINGCFPAGPPGGDPYSYWDMTGFQHRRFTLRQGEWTVVHDSGTAGTEWGSLHWNREPEGSIPNNARLIVYARAADDRSQLELKQFVEVQRAMPFTGTFGRYLQVKVIFRMRWPLISPVLSDLTVLPRYSWSDAGRISNDIMQHKAVLLKDGQVLVVGGSTYRRETYLYNPDTATWRPTAGVATLPRLYHTATRLADGRVLATGGARGNADNTAELYDPATETWTRTGNMTQPRRYHTATLLPNGRILVVGSDVPGQGATAELYDPATGTWTPTGSLLKGRSQHTAALLPGGRVLVAGGIDENGTMTASAEVYDPATGTWTSAGNMRMARLNHTATELTDGRVLVAGGTADTTQAASVEIYDPATGNWVATGHLNQRRHSHAATILRTGQVLITGGHHRSTGNLKSAELYDPRTGTWSLTNPMRAERYQHTLTLLNNGEVLATGGKSSVPADQRTAELFSP